MLRFSFIIAALLLANPLWAAILVRSGEHDGFTRLVVYFDRGQVWDLNRTDTGYQLIAEGLEEGFDLRQAYELIDRERVASLASSPDILAFELGCACEATTTVLSTGHLVIDVQDGLPIEQDVLTADASTPAVTLTEEDEDEPIVFDLPTRTEPQTVAALLEPEESADSIPEELTEFRRRLLENLGRSASLSLVTIDNTPDGDVLSRQAEAFIGALGPERAERADVTTAVDDALRRAVIQANTDQPARCPNPATFNIAEWGGEDSFSEQISLLRRSLIAEFDKIDRRQVLSLAKAYLYYGLIAEARHTLEQFELPEAQREALVLLSGLMDNSAARDASSALSGFAHCDGPILPWLLLDAPKTAKLGEEQRSALVREFANWPAGLQSMLGATLISTLQFRGYDTTASVLNDIISGGMEEKEDATADAVDAPNEILTEVDDGSERSIDALAVYLRRAIDTGTAIDLGQLDLAAAFERETTGLPVSDTLRALRLEAMAYRGDVQMLMAEIERFDAGIQEVDDDTLARIGQHVAALDNAQSMALFTIFAQRRGALERLPPAALEELASRHLDMGLPQVAARILEQRQDLDPPAETMARLSEALGRIDDAVTTLDALPADDASVRQADLLLKYARASQLSDTDKSALPTTLRDRVAWATADWENVGGETRQEAVSQMILSLQSADLSDAPLTTAKELQEKSQTARALLNELFDDQPE